MISSENQEPCHFEETRFVLKIFCLADCSAKINSNVIRKYLNYSTMPKVIFITCFAYLSKSLVGYVTTQIFVLKDSFCRKILIKVDLSVCKNI